MKNWLKILTQPCMNLTLNTSSEYRTRIIEAPGKWMGDADIYKIRKDLIEVASKAGGTEIPDYGVLQEENTLTHSIITIVYEIMGNRPVAFNALTTVDIDLGARSERVLHLGLVMVDPEVRGKGLSWILYGLTCIFLFLRNQLRPIWISNVTQVPAVVGMVGETFSDVFPSPLAGNRCTLSHVLIARRLIEFHRQVFGVGKEAKFDEKRFVITNAYTGGSDPLKKTFAKTTKHRTAAVNELCKEELNYRRGDDVLQLGKIDLNAARRFLTQNVPAGSIAGLVAAGFWVVLSRIALPVMHWADPTRQWQNLRPYAK